jgi:cellulose synthase/poly-beta-1,6-N-acetylglucosamine synthase-like glycosyltransferase
VGFAVWASGPWRDELDRAIGPVMAWVIPVLLAYIPGLVIGFMASTLVVSPYHGLELDPPVGPWPDGEWPPVTVVAAWNEEQAIEATLERLATTTYPGDIAVVLADNNSSDRTAELAEAAAARFGLDYRRVFEPEPASSTRSTGYLRRSTRRWWSPSTPTPTSTRKRSATWSRGNRASAGSARLRLLERSRRMFSRSPLTVA